MSRGADAAPLIVVNSGTGTLMLACQDEPTGYLKLPPGQTEVSAAVWDKVKVDLDMDLTKLQTVRVA